MPRTPLRPRARPPLLEERLFVSLCRETSSASFLGTFSKGEGFGDITAAPPSVAQKRDLQKPSLAREGGDHGAKRS